MLEIILLRFLCKTIGGKADDKGYSKAAFIILTVVLWFGGEILGFVIALLFFENFLLGYVLGIMGAFAGYGIIYLIVDRLEDKTGPGLHTNWQQQQTDAARELEK